MARADEGEFSFGAIGGEHARLGGDVAGRFENDEFAIAGAADADVEALIVVLVKERVVAVRGAKVVAKELELALLLLVFNGVEETCIVGGPNDGADALDGAGKGLAGLEIFDVEGVLAEAGGVSGVGEPASVFGDGGFSDGEKGVAFGELVAVEDDLFGPVAHGSERTVGATAVDGVLLAFLSAGGTTTLHRERELRRQSA